MEVTVEISMYPLTEAYEAAVIHFIQQIKQHKGLELETNGLSTQVFGEYDTVMNAIQQEMKNSLLAGKAVFMMKLAQGELRKEKLPEILK